MRQEGLTTRDLPAAAHANALLPQRAVCEPRAAKEGQKQPEQLETARKPWPSIEDPFLGPPETGVSSLVQWKALALRGLL